MAYRFTPADREAFKRCRRQWDLGATERQHLEPAEAAAAPDLELAVRDALAVYYFPGMWDWQRSVVLPLVLQGLARSLGDPAAAGGELAAGRALLERYFDWAPGVDRFSPVQVETRFEVNLPDPGGGDRELVLADGRPIRSEWTSRRRRRLHAVPVAGRATSGASPSTRPAAAAGPCPMPAAVPPGPDHPTRCR
jgi:hypothetical protein